MPSILYTANYHSILLKNEQRLITKVGLENVPYLTRGYGYIKCAMDGCIHSNERVTIGQSIQKTKAYGKSWRYTEVSIWKTKSQPLTMAVVVT